MNTEFHINNMPEYAKDYEFIVARQSDGEFWFWGAWENGFEADKVAHEIGGIVFHNIRIQGKR